MGIVKQLAGMRFSRLFVVGRELVDGELRAHWRCICDCGRPAIALGSSLRNGRTKSCGCLQAENRNQLKHGESAKSADAAEYRTWSLIRSRCRNKNSKAYKDYGGRGIIVCGRWDDFSLFLADMGRRPSSSHTIERVDTNGHYEPSNCRWATMKEQQRNRRNNKIFTHKGVTACLAELCEINGVKYSTAHQRLRRGMDIGRALADTLERLYG